MAEHVSRGRVARGTRGAGILCRALHRPGPLGRGLLTALTRALALATRLARTRRPALEECADKLRVLRDFEDPASALGPLWEEVSLRELVEAAYHRIPDDAVWVTEGLACLVADRLRSCDGASDGVVIRRLLADLPPAARVPAHAGVGLSISWTRLVELRRASEPAAIRRGLERFVREAEASALEGSVETVLDSLGFATRLLFPGLVPRIAPELEAVDERLPYWFWHGFGRALYFTPASFLPRTDSAWRAVGRAHSEPPSPAARDHAVEGLAWPLLMVHVRAPEVIARLLERHGELAESVPFRRGLEAAIAVWKRSTARPGDLAEVSERLRCEGLA
jgi:hypothetical protein